MLCLARCLELHHVQNRGEAILNVKIALALGPITQDAKAIGMLHQLTIEIEDVPVSITLAQNGDEPEDVTLEAKAFTICLNQALTGHLGCAI